LERNCLNENHRSFNFCTDFEARRESINSWKLNLLLWYERSKMVSLNTRDGSQIVDFDRKCGSDLKKRLNSLKFLRCLTFYVSSSILKRLTVQLMIFPEVQFWCLKPLAKVVKSKVPSLQIEVTWTFLQKKVMSQKISFCKSRQIYPDYFKQDL